MRTFVDFDEIIIFCLIIFVICNDLIIVSKICNKIVIHFILRYTVHKFYL